MYKITMTLLLVAVCAGCAHHRNSRASIALAPNVSEVKYVADPAVTRDTLAAAIPQFSRGAPPVMLASLRPARSIEQVLPDVQRIARKPLVAMTEYNGWYWYATEVAEGSESQTPGAFLSGYAVQKNGFLAWKW